MLLECHVSWLLMRLKSKNTTVEKIIKYFLYFLVMVVLLFCHIRFWLVKDIFCHVYLWMLKQKYCQECFVNHDGFNFVQTLLPGTKWNPWYNFLCFRFGFLFLDKVIFCNESFMLIYVINLVVILQNQNYFDF